MTHPPNELTQLLVAWGDGDKAALDQLVPLVHDELRRLARRYMGREQAGHTLQSTALVNEAYLRLVDYKNVRWQNRTHFFAVAAQLMRHILVDHARSYQYAKRGGGARKVALDDVAELSHERAADLIALDDALKSLAEFDQRKSQVVELRYFGGLSIEEAAEFLGISPNTVLRDWNTAKAWLYRELSKGGKNEG